MIGPHLIDPSSSEIIHWTSMEEVLLYDQQILMSNTIFKISTNDRSILWGLNNLIRAETIFSYLEILLIYQDNILKMCHLLTATPTSWSISQLLQPHGLFHHTGIIVIAMIIQSMTSGIPILHPLVKCTHQTPQKFCIFCINPYLMPWKWFIAWNNWHVTYLCSL